MAAAAEIGCGACLDLNYFMAHHRGLDVAKAREVPRWRDSTVFTPLERRVMEYAEAMCRTPLVVTDEMSAALLADLGPDGLIELTAKVGFMNLAARSNIALGISSEHYSDACGLQPLGGAVSDDPFTTHRGLLFTVAYEMLGSAVDAEDVLQESWLKWATVDRAEVRHPRAFLVRVVTRTALDRLRTVARRREDYVGPWLPEPLLTSPDVAEDVELADSLSTAMLLILETLSPTERAVFLLRDVFDVGYDELAEAVGKSEAAVRQIAHRARAHVAERRPRGAASQAETRHALAAFQLALETGELQPLVDVLAPDVVAFGDGGGIKQALPRPVMGADKVGKLMGHGMKVSRELGMTTELVQVNGSPALLIRADGEIDSVLTLCVEDGLVSAIYTVRNPEKLSRMAVESALSR